MSKSDIITCEGQYLMNHISGLFPVFASFMRNCNISIITCDSNSMWQHAVVGYNGKRTRLPYKNLSALLFQILDLKRNVHVILRNRKVSKSIGKVHVNVSYRPEAYITVDFGKTADGMTVEVDILDATKIKKIMPLDYKDGPQILNDISSAGIFKDVLGNELKIGDAVCVARSDGSGRMCYGFLSDICFVSKRFFVNGTFGNRAGVSKDRFHINTADVIKLTDFSEDKLKSILMVKKLSK